MRPVILAALACLALAAPAAAQQPSAWREYAYPEMGFLIQFPLAPTVSTATWPAPGGRPVPATVYAARERRATYRVTVADFSGSPDDRAVIMSAAQTAARQGGEIKFDLEAHVDLQFGRQLSIAGKDGSYGDVAVFMLGRRLYVVEGWSLPPNAENRSDRIVRFVETLSFPNQPPGPLPAAVQAQFTVEAP